MPYDAPLRRHVGQFRLCGPQCTPQFPLNAVSFPHLSISIPLHPSPPSLLPPQNAIQKQETELAETEKKLSELRPPAETYDPAEIDAINKKVKELSMSQRNYLNQERELQQVIHDAKRRLADSTRQCAEPPSRRCPLHAARLKECLRYSAAPVHPEPFSPPVRPRLAYPHPCTPP